MSRAKNLESQRAKKYPAGYYAMRGFIVIEQVTFGARPKPPASQWPKYYDRFDDPYSHFEDVDTEPANPTPYEIDQAWRWVSLCDFMWGRTARDDEWKIFIAYANGAGPTVISEITDIGRGKIQNMLDHIFRRIQEEAERRAFMDDAGSAKVEMIFV